MTTPRDSTKWVLDKERGCLEYTTVFTIGQIFKVAFRKFVSDGCYYFAKSLYMKVHRINEYIETFLPRGNCNRNFGAGQFIPFTKDTLTDALREREGTADGKEPRANDFFWRAIESGKHVASVQIESPDAIITAGNELFKVTLTAFIPDDNEGRAAFACRSIAMLLGFLDLYERRVSMADYVLSVNQHLTRQLGLSDLSKIVAQFL